MRGDVAVYAVVRIVVPQVTGRDEEEMILSALAELPLHADLPPGADVVKYEISVRRPGGAEENKQILIDQDHLSLLEVELDAGAKIFDLSLHTGDNHLHAPPDPLLQHPSTPIVLN